MRERGERRVRERARARARERARARVRERERGTHCPGYLDGASGE